MASPSAISWRAIVLAAICDSNSPLFARFMTFTSQRYALQAMGRLDRAVEEQLMRNVAWAQLSKKPRQVLPPLVATEMNQMMNHVVEEGTARRAKLDGIQAAGKTGTTNAFRDTC